MERCKLKNRRIDIFRTPEGNVQVAFTRLKRNEEKPTCGSFEIGGKIVNTQIAMSKASAVALYYLLQKELTLADFEAFEKNQDL